MAGQADGSIIVDTQLDSEGFKAGSAELKGAIKSLSKEMSNLGPMFKEAMSGSGGAVNSFKTETQNLENTISELEGKLQDLGSAQIPTKDFADLTAEEEKAGQKLEQLLNKQERLKAIGVSEDSTQWKALSYDIEQAAQKYDSLTAAKQRMQASGSAYISGADTEQYAQMEAALESARAKLSAMRAEVSRTHGFMQRITSAAKSFTSAIGQAAKNVAGKLVSGIKSAASSMAKMVKHGKSMNGQFGGLISGAKKFALSLLGARGVYALLRKAVSAYMSENQQLSNTLSACWSGIGNALGPIISKLISLVATAVAYVTQFLNLLGLVGKSTTKAIGSAGGAASKETDKLKRQLASFDELNILSDNSSDSGGGGGSTDTGSLPDVTLPDWAKLMVDQLKSGQWAEAAKTLTSQLNTMIASVDWAGAGEKIAYYLDGTLTFLATAITTFDWKSLASNFASLLNSLIDGVDWGNLGTILTTKWAILLQLLDGFFGSLSGASVSKALTDFMYGTVNAADWVGISASLSQNISNFISEIDFTALAQALSTQLHTVYQSMIAAVSNFDWGMLGRKIADFINGIDWGTLVSDCATMAGKVISGALDLLVGFAENLDWEKLGSDLLTGLESMVENIDWPGIVSKAFELLGAALAGATQLVATVLQSLWEALCQGWDDTKSYFTDHIEEAGGDIITGLWNGIREAFSNVGTWIKENIFQPFIDGFKSVFGINSPSTVMAEQGGFIVSGLLQGITEGWDSITEFFSTAVSNLTEWLSSGWETIKTDASTAWSNIKTTVTGAWSNIKSGASTGYEAVRSGVSSAWSSVKSGTSTAWSNAKSAVTSAWDSVKSKTSQVGSSVASATSTAFTKAKNYVTDKMADAKKNAEKSWDEIKSNTTSVGSSIAADVNSAWNKIRDYVKSSLSTTKSNTTSTWNAMKSTIASTTSNMSSAVSSKFAAIQSTIKSKVNGAKSAITSGFESARSAMVSKMTSAMNTIKGQGWYSVGTGICSGIQSGLNAGWSWLSNTVSNLARRLLNSAKSALGIHSPSRVFRDAVGLNIGYGIGEGIERSEGSVLGSVTSVADAIAEEFNAGDYEAANIIPTTEINGVLTSFSDTITDGLRSLLDKLQAIAENVSFAVPVSATSLIPYSTSAREQGGSDTTSGLSGLSMDKLMDLLVQLLTNQTTAIVTAIQNYSGTQVNIDKDSLTTAVIEEINRRTRMAGASPLLT